MTLNTIDIDRRQAPRYAVKEHTFAVVRSTQSHDLQGLANMSHGQVGLALFKSKPAKMGQIMNLSLKGLCFNYIVNDDKIPEGNEVDILFAEDNFYLGALRCRIVREMVASNELPFTPIVMKQRAVAFEALKPEQEQALNHFLKVHGQKATAPVSH
ncbi:MAG: hypothetical protein QNJ22_15330 [Desulfosarcinaceae bacterium]|nr:hypothetical protein [Desulfosarcinaceae bacterium]